MSTPITPQMVKQLRDRTDMPMGECKKALEVSGALFGSSLPASVIIPAM